MQELKANERTELGKKVNALRRAGFLPAVVYGEGVPSRPLSVPMKDFEKVYKETGESTLFTLDVTGSPYNVLIHDIKNDPITGKPLHVDFYAVRMDKKIRMRVPIEFIGEAPAVKNLGGIPVKVMQEIEVEALPKDLPRSLAADLSHLEALDVKLLVKNIAVPRGVVVFTDPEEIVFIVEPPRSEEELAALKETSTAEAPVEVKTEQEVRREAKTAKEVAEEGEAPQV